MLNIIDSLYTFQVLPRQRQGQRQEFHDVWVVLHKKGLILTGNCSCMAGVGSACSHLASLLFKLQACVQLELSKEVACTSQLCTWNRSRTKAEPAPLKSINFNRPRKDSKTPSLTNPPPHKTTKRLYNKRFSSHHRGR